MRTNAASAAAVCFGLLGALAVPETPKAVTESAREIPVCVTADVVVVGGSCGAVAAAQAAAQAGAKVFLVAPRPYLGDDVAGCLRLWLEPGETPVSPLARSLFVLTNNALPFTYSASAAASPRHADSNCTALCDGRYQQAASQSAEFAGDVTFTLALDKTNEVDSVELHAFSRKGDFLVGGGTVSVSADHAAWSAPVALTVTSDDPSTERIAFSAPVHGTVKALKVTVRKQPGAKRLLLGEIVVRQKMPEGGLVIVPTPLRVKQALDRALLDAGISYLTGSYATDLLRDAGGNPAGIVMANRSGRQAVLAKVVIDATERATVARWSGAHFSPQRGGRQSVTRVLIAGEEPSATQVTSCRQLPGEYDAPVTVGDRKTSGKRIAGKAFEFAMTLNLNDGSFPALAEVEQRTSDHLFVKSLLEIADTPFIVPSDYLTAQQPLLSEWPGSAAVALGCFKPKGVSRLFVLGGCAHMPRTAAEKLLRPLALMEVGSRVGAAAAAEAKGLPAPEGVMIAARGEAAEARGEVREALNGVRPFQTPAATLTSPKTALPVLGVYDVVVVGGGTCGAPAGIAAARQGAKTLVIEQLHGLGGIATLGMIGVYCFGNICGFTSEYDEGVKALGAEVNIMGKREWFRRECRRAGAEIWFGALACGALTDGNRVTGVIVATPDGRGVVLAKSVVDATGNSDVAAAAGAPCTFLGSEEIAVQGVGLSPRRLGASYINSDFGYANDCDAGDLWLFGVRGRARCDANSWDVSQLVQSRERQRIVGDATVTPLDILNKRTFPDTVVQARSNFDSHGYTIADICYLAGPSTPRVHWANIPYGAMLPKGVENLVVAGLGLSAHRDAMPVIRMQPDVQNMGYVAGVAAATAARAGTSCRAINVRDLQRHLVEAGVIPKEVLEWKDSWAIPPKELAQAVQRVGDACRDVNVVLDHAEEALPLLREAYAQAATPAQRLSYAQVLGTLGDATGVETLLAAVQDAPEERALSLHWSERMGRRMSDGDCYLIALGRTRDRRALDPLLAKARTLDGRSPFFAFRAVTLALEALGDRAAAPALAELLKKPAVGGHAMTSVSEISANGYGNGTERNLALRELALARVLYRLGDCDGVAEHALKQYALDLRGVYALHATAVLKSGKK
jgi:flavin-dependent dehydrogenase